jgi:peptidoglycan hydrolase-like protein with peptidoglycan-binding domain
MSIPSIGAEVIRLNSNGETETDSIVSEVQQALNQVAGTSIIAENGIFSRDTENAIREFQTTHNMEPSGTINQLTVDALNHAVEQEQLISNSEPSRIPLDQNARNRQIFEHRLHGQAVQATLSRPLPPHYFDSVRALTTTPTTLHVNGNNIDVYGANPQELRLIQNTLERLPASHVRTIPRIVVAETAAHGRIREAGNSISPETAAQHLNSNQYRAGLPAQGLTEMLSRQPSDLARLELTHANLSAALNAGMSVSPTLMHETGHWVDRQFGLSRRIRPEDLGEVVSGSIHNPTGEAGGVGMERFADAYGRYYRGVLNDDIARATLRRLLTPTEGD